MMCRGLNASAGSRGGPSSIAGSYAGARASYAGSYAGGGGSYAQSEGSSPRASSVVSGMTGFESVGGPDTLSETSRCSPLARPVLGHSSGCQIPALLARTTASHPGVQGHPDPKRPFGRCRPFIAAAALSAGPQEHADTSSDTQKSCSSDKKRMSRAPWDVPSSAASVPLSEVSAAGLRSLSAPHAAAPLASLASLRDHRPPGPRSSNAGSHGVPPGLRCARMPSEVQLQLHAWD